MSIALATKGRLWPTGGTNIIREQVTEIETEVERTIDVESAVDGVLEVEVCVVSDVEVQSAVEIIDPITGEVIDIVVPGNDGKVCYD